MRSVSSLACLTLKSASSSARLSDLVNSRIASSSASRLPESRPTELRMRFFRPSSAMDCGSLGCGLNVIGLAVS